MPLPSTGIITLNDVRLEFGGSSPSGLSEYYAQGAYVPKFTEGINGPIPSSGLISLKDFRGAPVSNDVDFTFTSEQTYVDSGAFDYPSFPRGYSTVWGAGGSSYGSISSGDRISTEGWGIASVSYYQETDPASNFEAGITINMNDTSYGTSEFSIGITAGSKVYSISSTAFATADNDILVNYSSGTKYVRSLYFDLGPEPEGDHLKWKNGENIVVTVERL